MRENLVLRQQMPRDPIALLKQVHFGMVEDTVNIIYYEKASMNHVSRVFTGAAPRIQAGNNGR
jgi:predicted Ser/Thr protein kinase